MEGLEERSERGQKRIWINDGWKIPTYDEKYKCTYSRSSKNPTQKKHKDMPMDITVSWWKLELKRTIVGNSLVAQWLGVCLLIQGVKVQSLVGKLRFPHDVWPGQKKIFFNWAIVKCLEKKGQDTPTEQRITIYFWSETIQTIGHQSDTVKLQKKIKNLPCPTAWSSIACQKHLSKMKAKRTSKKAKSERVPAFRKHWRQGSVSFHPVTENLTRILQHWSDADCKAANLLCWCCSRWREEQG